MKNCNLVSAFVSNGKLTTFDGWHVFQNEASFSTPLLPDIPKKAVTLLKNGQEPITHSPHIIKRNNVTYLIRASLQKRVVNHPQTTYILGGEIFEIPEYYENILYWGNNDYSKRFIRFVMDANTKVTFSKDFDVLLEETVERIFSSEKYDRIIYASTDAFCEILIENNHIFLSPIDVQM